MNSLKHTEVVRKYCVSAILTGKLPCDIYGSVQQLRAFSEALYATREFDRVLTESSVMEEVIGALNHKRSAAAKFRREYGVIWPA